MPGHAHDVLHVGNLLGRHNADGNQAGVARKYVDRVGFGIVGAAGPVGATGRGAERKRRIRTIDIALDRRREHRADLEFRDIGQGLVVQLGREIDQDIGRDAVARIGRRLGGERLGRRVPLAGDVAFFNRSLFDRPDRLAGDAIEHIEEALLGGHRDGLDRACHSR